MSLADEFSQVDPAHIGLVDWGPKPLWRVYSNRFGPTEFNATGRGNSRFSPLEHGGAIVPTLYAGSTVDVALMEGVLHDMPAHSAGHRVTLHPRTERRRVARLMPDQRLRLVDFTAVGLRKLGLIRSAVIDGDATSYPQTRRLAAWVYANATDAQGISWSSRHDDTGQAVVLFEPRLGPIRLDPVEVEQPFTDGPHFLALMALVERLGASLVIAS